MSAGGDSDIPVLVECHERYAGRWVSSTEYAHNFADETGLQSDWPDTAVTYFNWDAWVRGLLHE